MNLRLILMLSFLDIRAGTRTDKQQHFAEKVLKVESILAADSNAKERSVKSVEKRAVATEKEKDVPQTKEEETAQTVPSASLKSTGTWASMLRK